MLVGLTCTCNGSETLVRRVFKKCGLSDWMKIPIYQGQTDCLAWVEAHKNLEDAPVLYDFIKNNSIYVLVVGFTDDFLMFANIKNGSLKEQIEAEALITRLANA